MILYFGNIGLKRLANKPTNYDEAYTTRFSVIIIAFAFFFFPLKFDDNYKNSLFQNMFSFFVKLNQTMSENNPRPNRSGTMTEKSVVKVWI